MLKKSFLTLALSFLTTVYLSAKTTVYLFIPSMANFDATLFIDGKEMAKLNAPIKKTMDDNMFRTPFKVAKSGWVEIEFANEEKSILTVNIVHTNPMNLNTSTLQAEMQLDLQDGETIYIELGRKGFSDCKLKVLEEKKGLKKLNDQKAHKFEKIEISND